MRLGLTQIHGLESGKSDRLHWSCFKNISATRLAVESNVLDRCSFSSCAILGSTSSTSSCVVISGNPISKTFNGDRCLCPSQISPAEFSSLVVGLNCASFGRILC